MLLLSTAGDTPPPPVASLAHDPRSGESAAFARTCRRRSRFFFLVGLVLVDLGWVVLVPVGLGSRGCQQVWFGWFGLVRLVRELG